MDRLDIDELKQRLATFSAERDWLKLDSPKNLSMAVATEAGELLDVFQWVTEIESFQLDEATRVAVQDEIADVMTNLVRLAGLLDINITTAIHQKIEKNALKYPLDKPVKIETR